MCPQGIYQAMPVCFHIISGEWMVMVFKTFWVNIQKAKMATKYYWIWLGTTWICEKEMWSCYDSNLHTESPRTTRIRARIFFTTLYFSNLLNFFMHWQAFQKLFHIDSHSRFFSGHWMYVVFARTLCNVYT